MALFSSDLPSERPLRLPGDAAETDPRRAVDRRIMDEQSESMSRRTPETKSEHGIIREVQEER